jgi:hypothetical protein
MASAARRRPFGERDEKARSSDSTGRKHACLVPVSGESAFFVPEGHRCRRPLARGGPRPGLGACLEMRHHGTPSCLFSSWGPPGPLDHWQAAPGPCKRTESGSLRPTELPPGGSPRRGPGPGGPEATAGALWQAARTWTFDRLLLLVSIIIIIIKTFRSSQLLSEMGAPGARY